MTIVLFVILHLCRKNRDVRPSLDIQDVHDISPWEIQRIRDHESQTTFGATLSNFFESASAAAANAAAAATHTLALARTASTGKMDGEEDVKSQGGESEGSLSDAEEGGKPDVATAPGPNPQANSHAANTIRIKPEATPSADTDGKATRSKPTLYRSPSQTHNHIARGPSSISFSQKPKNLKTTDTAK